MTQHRRSVHATRAHAQEQARAEYAGERNQREWDRRRHEENGPVRTLVRDGQTVNGAMLAPLPQRQAKPAKSIRSGLKMEMTITGTIARVFREKTPWGKMVDRIDVSTEDGQTFTGETMIGAPMTVGARITFTADVTPGYHNSPRRFYSNPRKARATVTA